MQSYLVPGLDLRAMSLHSEGTKNKLFRFFLWPIGFGFLHSLSQGSGLLSLRSGSFNRDFSKGKTVDQDFTAIWSF